MAIMFDYGHGGNDPGAVYKGRKESDDVLRLGKAVAKLVRAAGIEIDETRTNDATLSLNQRSNMERKKKYDFFISFHRNAFKAEQANGVETFVYKINNEKAKVVAAEIQNALVQIGFKNRGVKTADFHVLRETYAPAVLIEVGFIDNTNDNKLFDSKFNAIAAAIAEAIIKVVGKKKKEFCSTCGQELLKI